MAKFKPVMSEYTRQSIRGNARTVGVLLQGLSVLTLLATFYAAFQVAKFGNQHGVTSSNDPAPWIIVAVGLIASLILAGLGYALAISCAIYDQNEVHLARTLGALRTAPVSPPTRPHVAREAPQAAEVPITPPALAPLPVSVSESSTTSLGGVASVLTLKSRLWAFLTQERHFR